MGCVILPQRMEVLFYLYNFTTMSHCAMHLAQGQKMRSLVGVPVLQVVQHVRSLEQLRVERIYHLTFMDTADENTEDNYVSVSGVWSMSPAKKVNKNTTCYFP